MLSERVCKRCHERHFGICYIGFFDGEKVQCPHTETRWIGYKRFCVGLTKVKGPPPKWCLYKLEHLLDTQNACQTTLRKM